MVGNKYFYNYLLGFDDFPKKEDFEGIKDLFERYNRRTIEEIEKNCNIPNLKVLNEAGYFFENPSVISIYNLYGYNDKYTYEYIKRLYDEKILFFSQLYFLDLFENSILSEMALDLKNDFQRNPSMRIFFQMGNPKGINYEASFSFVTQKFEGIYDDIVLKDILQYLDKNLYSTTDDIYHALIKQMPLDKELDKTKKYYKKILKLALSRIDELDGVHSHTSASKPTLPPLYFHELIQLSDVNVYLKNEKLYDLYLKYIYTNTSKGEDKYPRIRNDQRKSIMQDLPVFSFHYLAPIYREYNLSFDEFYKILKLDIHNYSDDSIRIIFNCFKFEMSHEERKKENTYHGFFTEKRSKEVQQILKYFFNISLKDYFTQLKAIDLVKCFLRMNKGKAYRIDNSSFIKNLNQYYKKYDIHISYSTEKLLRLLERSKEDFYVIDEATISFNDFRDET